MSLSEISQFTEVNRGKVATGMKDKIEYEPSIYMKVFCNMQEWTYLEKGTGPQLNACYAKKHNEVGCITMTWYGHRQFTG